MNWRKQFDKMITKSQEIINSNQANFLQITYNFNVFLNDILKISRAQKMIQFSIVLKN